MNRSREDNSRAWKLKGVLHRMCAILSSEHTQPHRPSHSQVNLHRRLLTFYYDTFAKSFQKHPVMIFLSNFWRPLLGTIRYPEVTLQEELQANVGGQAERVLAMF